jgi:hypothetical protein
MDPVTLAFVSLVGFLGLGLLWFRVVRPILADLGLFGGEQADETVKHYTLPPARDYVAPHPAPLPKTPTDLGPSAVPVRPSVLSAPIGAVVDALTVDRTRAAIVRVLVAQGWSTAEIRDRLVGANDAIGDEVKAARIALGLEPELPRRSPIAGRELPPDAQFFDEPEPAAAER